jgi:cellobiose phosphorylase
VQKLEVAVDPSDAVKVWHLSIENRSKRPRRLRVFGYVEWVLGNHRETMRASTLTSYHPEVRAILARNPFSAFPRSRAFLATTSVVHSATGDRGEFFGNFASRARPAALGHPRLLGRFGSGYDPSAALSVEVTLEAGARTTLAFVLGAGDDERQALQLAERHGRIDEAQAVLTRAREYWTELLGRVRVRTPDPAFDLLTNHWLLYQVLSCRFWGRSGFYQSGGAYGFRDQLQDSLALVHVRPDLVRQHLLLSASR